MQTEGQVSLTFLLYHKLELLFVLLVFFFFTYAYTEMHYVEMRPPTFDSSGRTKYPVLFQVYGGPGSQLVDTKYKVDWHTYLCVALNYIVVRVDGRGTGMKGRRYRDWVRGKLGSVEVDDQVEAARVWREKPYVDRRRVGIWGWVSQSNFFFLFSLFFS